MANILRFGRVCGLVIAGCGLALTLASCQLAKNQITYDRSAGLDRQDYRDVLSPAAAPAEASAPVPDFQPVLSTPQELRLPTPLVTVSVNQTVGLRDLLFELADQASIDLELDPQIHGSIIFTAKARPFDEVVNRICQMAGLRYKFQRNVLRVELDRPYVKTYSVDFLNISRSGKSSINTTVSIGGDSAGGGDSGGGGDSASGGGGGSSGVTGKSSGGSASSIDSVYNGDVWKELDDSIKHILTATDTDVMLATLADPVATPVNPTPPPLPVNPDGTAAPVPPPLPGAPQVAAMPAAVAPTLNVMPSSEPAMPVAPSTYSISRQTGVVTVFASERQQVQVEKFLNEFRRRATTEVLIEAKVLQVDLGDEYAAGINWGSFNLTGLSRLTPNFTAPAMDPANSSAFTAVLQPRDNLQPIIQALGRFGTVRTLSSPRVTAMNNQPAVVNVAQSIVYFTIKNSTTTVTSTGPSTSQGGLETTAKSVPEGVLLNVIPSANPDTGEVFLSVRPTITKLVSFVNDPLPQLLNPAQTLQSKVPQMLTQEMESLLRLQSGQTMVMGGLMQDKNTVSESGIPIAADVPFIGNLFKNHGDKVVKSELVIFLKATIVAGSNVDEADRKVYNTFGFDRHPSKM